jgi:threonyl-tRNA synthetase
VLPVSDRHDPAASTLVEELRAAGLRADGTGSEETLGKRVREAEVDRIPYVVVLGDTEVGDGSVALRTRGTKGQRSLPRADFLAYAGDKVKSRSFDP